MGGVYLCQFCGVFFFSRYPNASQGGVKFLDAELEALAAEAEDKHGWSEVTCFARGLLTIGFPMVSLNEAFLNPCF